MNEAHDQSGGYVESPAGTTYREAPTVLTTAQTMTTISTVSRQIEVPVNLRAADMESESGETTAS